MFTTYVYSHEQYLVFAFLEASKVAAAKKKKKKNSQACVIGTASFFIPCDNWKTFFYTNLMLPRGNRYAVVFFQTIVLSWHKEEVQFGSSVK